MTLSEPSRKSSIEGANRRRDRHKIGAYLRAGAPWLVAAVVLAYLFKTTSLTALGAALAEVPVAAVIALVVSFNLAALAADSGALRIAVGAALKAARAAPSPGAAVAPAPTPPGYRQVALVRCASALLSVINFGVGQGGVVYFLHRRHRVPVEVGAGAVLLTSTSTMLVMALVVAVGLLAGAVPMRDELALLAWLAAASVPLAVGLRLLRPRWLAQRRLLRHLFQISWGALLGVVATRGLHLMVFVVGHWLALGIFGVDVPPALALLQLPALFFVGTLPISPSGLGTSQAAAVFFFAPYASGAPDARAAAVLAYSLSCHAIGVACLLAIGLPCWRRIERRRQPPKSPQSGP